MVSKREKHSNAKKDWADDEISLLTDMLETNPCLCDVYNHNIAGRSHVYS